MISKGFEYVAYKLNQWPTGTTVQPFCGGKQWTQPGLSTKYPKLQSYQNKQQRAYETIPYPGDYRKRHNTNLSYCHPRTRDFSWRDGSYNPRHSPRHTNFGKARSYHGTYSNQRYPSNGMYTHQDPRANPITHYNDEFPAESHSRNTSWTVPRTTTITMDTTLMKHEPSLFNKSQAMMKLPGKSDYRQLVKVWSDYDATLKNISDVEEHKAQCACSP
ncbi:hypothetical protein SK128_025433 [Halocaridina rubra]|uniref:Uncharacterized protein n=1 Tax=Halocaridina rubra TaxID=373956 RepID=A0AAN9ADH7_HALRR